MISEHRNVVDAIAFLCAGVAAVSLAQAALIVSVIAGLLSAVLAGVRLYDRVRHGPSQG